MEKNNERGLKVTGKGEDSNGKYLTVTLLDTSIMNRNDRIYAGDMKHLIRGIVRHPRVLCEVDPYHDYRFQTKPSEDRYAPLWSTIVTANVCAAIEDIRHNAAKQEVTGVLRPWGPQARFLRDLIERDDVSFTFGMRALALPNGKIDKVICWDLLPE